MTHDIKLQICQDRLLGFDIYTIATKVGVTRQTIALFLNKLPKDGNARQQLPDLHMNIMVGICKEYLHGLSPQAIAAKTNIPIHDINGVFFYITARKLSPVRRSRYPIVTDWMIKHSYTIGQMADSLGVPQHKLGNIIRGKAHMSLEIAKLINGFTGITLEAIYEKDLAKECLK